MTVAPWRLSDTEEENRRSSLADWLMIHLIICSINMRWQENVNERILSSCSYWINFAAIYWLFLLYLQSHVIIHLSFSFVLKTSVNSSMSCPFHIHGLYISLLITKRNTFCCSLIKSVADPVLDLGDTNLIFRLFSSRKMPRMCGILPSLSWIRHFFFQTCVFWLLHLLSRCHHIDAPRAVSRWAENVPGRSLWNLRPSQTHDHGSVRSCYHRNVQRS